MALKRLEDSSISGISDALFWCKSLLRHKCRYLCDKQMHMVELCYNPMFPTNILWCTGSPVPYMCISTEAVTSFVPVKVLYKVKRKLQFSASWVLLRNSGYCFHHYNNTVLIKVIAESVVRHDKKHEQSGWKVKQL